MVRSLIVSVLMAGLSVAAAQDGGHVLRGAVHDATGQSVVGAWLEVRPLKVGAISAAAFEEGPFQAMRSDADGRWEFSGLTEGTWLLTAVTPAEPGPVPLTDEELQKMAQPGPDYHVPAGVAVTRLVRRFEPGKAPTSESMDVGLALGPRPPRPLLGQLVGAFDPDRFAYEVRLERTTVTAGGVSVVSVTGFGGGTITSTSIDSNTATGETTVSTETIVDGVSSSPNPLFRVVPDHDGRFDFGSLEVAAYDLVCVESIPLTAADEGFGGPAFRLPIVAFEPWTLGIEIPLPVQHGLTLTPLTAEGETLPEEEAAQVEFSIWSEQGSEMGGADSIPRSLTEGTYLAQIRLGELASPIAAFTVAAAGGPTGIQLALQPCPPFTVHFVDAKGTALGDAFLALGTEASQAFPEPCRVLVMCEAGVAHLEGVLPGTYDVQFRGLPGGPFTRSIELKPDGVAVVVTEP